MGVQDWRHSEDPNGPIPEELLARYVAGTLEPELHRALARQLAHAPQQRAFAKALETLAGHWLLESEPVPPADAGAMLAAILADHPRRR